MSYEEYTFTKALLDRIEKLARENGRLETEASVNTTILESIEQGQMLARVKNAGEKLEAEDA